MVTFGRAVPALPVRSIERAVAHYRGPLGFTVLVVDESFAVLERGGARIHLWRAGDEDWRGRTGPDDSPVRSGAESFLAGTASFRIDVDDVDALFATLPADVLHPVSRGGPRETDFGTRELATLDPDGNLLELVRWLR